MSRRRPGRAGVGDVLLSQLPAASFVHRLSVLTKLVGLVALTVALYLNPSWSQVTATVIVSALAVAAARVPRSAAPRVPYWYWVPLLVGLAFAAVGGGAERYVRLTAVTFAFIVLSLVLAWTTEHEELAPALAAAARPLQRVGLPVGEWAVVTGLCVRSLPLLIDEVRTVVAARKLRSQPRGRRLAAGVVMVIDLVSSVMASTIRRSTDLGTTIAGRGGATPPQGRLAPGWRDMLALLVVAVACALPVILSG